MHFKYENVFPRILGAQFITLLFLICPTFKETFFRRNKKE